MARNYGLSKQGATFIKTNEGKSLIAYPDGKGINSGYSIGYGHYLTPTEISTYATGDGAISISNEVAEWLFQSDVSERVKALNAVLTVDIPQPMFDALIDYGFSMSGATLAKTDLVKMVNGGYTKDAIKNQWLTSWVKYGGDLNYKPLVERRKKEYALATSKMNEVFENIGIEYQNPLTVLLIALLALAGFSAVIYYVLK